MTEEDHCSALTELGQISCLHKKSTIPLEKKSISKTGSCKCLVSQEGKNVVRRKNKLHLMIKIKIGINYRLYLVKILLDSICVKEHKNTVEEKASCLSSEG